MRSRKLRWQPHCLADDERNKTKDNFYPSSIHSFLGFFQFRET